MTLGDIPGGASRKRGALQRATPNEPLATETRHHLVPNSAADTYNDKTLLRALALPQAIDGSVATAGWRC